jgi:hypothetical protein
MFRLFKYSITFASILIVAFTTAPVISCKQITVINTKTVYLKMDTMQEATNIMIDSTPGPALAAMFLCGEKNIKHDTTPWADAFLCVPRNKEGLALDTVLLLDASLRQVQYNIDPTDYWTGLKKATKLGQCKILVPTSLQGRIKNYKYKYCSVTLITDD